MMIDSGVEMGMSKLQSNPDSTCSKPINGEKQMKRVRGAEGKRSVVFCPIRDCPDFQGGGQFVATRIILLPHRLQVSPK